MNLQLQDQEGFEAFRHAYRAAIKEVRTKIEILSEDFAVRHDYNPIHHIELSLIHISNDLFSDLRRSKGKERV